MNLDKYKKYAPVVVRVSIALVFLWFGYTQLFNTQTFLGYAPAFSYDLAIGAENFLKINGAIEILFGTLLLLGIFTRLVALFLTIHFIGIVYGLGYNDIAIRDAGLTLATFSILLHGKDFKCLDHKLQPKLEKTILKYLYFLG